MKKQLWSVGQELRTARRFFDPTGARVPAGTPAIVRCASRPARGEWRYFVSLPDFADSWLDADQLETRQDSFLEE